MNKKEIVRRSKLILNIKQYLENINEMHPVNANSCAEDLIDIIEDSYKKRHDTLNPKHIIYEKVRKKYEKK